MLKFRIALVTVFLICCVAFVACERGQQVLEPSGMMDTDDAPSMDMDMMEIMMDYTSWEHVMLPAPTMTVEEAAAAMNPGGTGAAHVGKTTRTAYFNEVGAMANKAGVEEYPVGTMIVKSVMDPTETFVQQVVTMTKTDDAMYADNNYWIYGATGRASETEELMTPQQLPITHRGCHDCHSKATNDSVFVSLSTDAEGTGDGDGAGTMNGGTGDGDAMNGANGNGNANGNGANGAGDDA